MARSRLVSRLCPEFDDFLYASIGEDNNGMQLTVLSALARLDVDPWAEATTLASLPQGMAIRRLVSLISALPHTPSTHRDPATLAARLVALLPDHGGAWRNELADDFLPARTRALRIGILAGVIISFQWVVPSCHPSAKVGDSAPPTSSTTSTSAPYQSAGLQPTRKAFASEW
jgi:hypothetical protein